MSLLCFLFPCWPIFLLSLHIQRISAIATNRTIDDYYGDSATGLLPIYSDNWYYGPTCSICEVHPDANLAFDASWHDAASNASTNSTVHNITLTFSGTAIWVYGIMLNSMPPPIVTFTNLSFTLDGTPGGAFVHVPNPATEQIDYNVTIYNKTGLENAEHTLIMTMMQDPNPSVLLFDWAMYTYENQSDNANTTRSSGSFSHWRHHGSDSSEYPSGEGRHSNTSSHVNKGAIAGGVVGGVCAMALLGGALFYWYRRRRKHAIRVIGRDLEGNGQNIEPYLAKSVIDPTPAPIGPSLYSYGEPFSPCREKAWPTSPVRMYAGEVIDIRADAVLESNTRHGELKDQVDDLQRQVATLRSALSAGGPDTLQQQQQQQQTLTAPSRPPDMAHRRRGIVDHKKWREQLNDFGRRRGAKRDTLGTDPPPAYDH